MAKTRQPVKEKQPLPPDGSLPWNADDDHLALKIAEQWQGNFAYFHACWHEYRENCWRKSDSPEIKRAVRLFLREHRKHLPKGVSQGRVNAISAMLEDDLYLSDRRIIEMQEEARHYIPLKNGLYNLKTGKLEDHRRDLHFTNQLNFAYDPAAEWDTWQRYLHTSLVDENGKPDQDMIMLVQEAMAYSMTERTDMKSSFWLVGKPDSGKSVLIALIRSLMGSMHATIDLNQLAQNRFMLAEIVGKRVVTFTEADSSAFIPDALYKAMVGGTDEIYVDVKNKPGIAFVPTAKFWWAMNGAPRFNDRSGATLNRLRVILFDRTVPADQRIGNLSELLDAEKAGIFNWILLGYRRLNLAGSFTSPARSEAWRETYRLENDTEAIFTRQCLDFGNGYKISTRELYNEYKSWCIEYGYKPKNQTQLAKEWRRLGLEDWEHNGNTWWNGAKLKEKRNLDS